MSRPCSDILSSLLPSRKRDCGVLAGTGAFRMRFWWVFGSGLSRCEKGRLGRRMGGRGLEVGDSEASRWAA